MAPFDAPSNAMNHNIDVALVLWNTDVIQLASLVLCRRNLVSTGIEPSEGLDRIGDVIASSGAPVVVFDLEPPYARSAAVLSQLLNRFIDRSFVMTCADPMLAVKATPWLSGHNIFQKPYAMADMADTVCSLIRLHSSSTSSFVM